MSAESEIAAIKAKPKPSKPKLSSAAVAAEAKAKLRAKASSPTSRTTAPADHEAFALPPLDPDEAVVYDPALARGTTCIEVEVAARKVVFSPGAAGALSDTQKALYCQQTEQRQLSPRLQERQEKMREAVAVCKPEVAALPKGERLEPWLGCLSRELRSRKQRLS